MHGQLLSDPDQLVNEIRGAAMDVAVGEIWIEKLILDTRPVTSIEDLSTRGDSLGDVARILQGLLDEPETGLDQDGQTRLEDLLQIQPKDLTILMTTHSIDRGLAWGTRVAFLSQGRIVFDEQTDHITTMDLKSKYTKLVELV